MKALKKLVFVAALSLPLATFAQEAAKPAEPPKVEAPKPADPPKISVTPYGIIGLSEYKNDGLFTGAQDYAAYVADEDEGAFVMSAKQSRFGLNVGVPAELAGGVAVSGKIEADFMGGGSSSYTSANLRLRHAYLSTDIPLGPGKLSLLFGQTDGLLNALHPESTSYLANPLFQQAGNIHRRSGQIRIGYGFAGDAFALKLEAAVLNPTDTPAAGVDATYNTGNRSGMGDFEGRLGFTLKPIAGFGGTVGVAYHTHQRAFDDVGFSATNPAVEKVTASAFGVDAVLDLSQYLALRGEYFSGEGMDDSYAGIASTAVFGAAGSREAVKSDGYWAQAIIKPFPLLYLLAGMGQETVDEYLNASLTGAQRVENKMIHGGLLFNVSKAWRFGLEYLETTSTTRANGTTAGAAQTDLKGSQLSVSTQLRF
jgi:hypothetical protein